VSKTPPNPVVQEIARHQSRLRAFVRCLMVRSSDVDDLLQEINVVLWEKCDEFQPGSDFWAWASQIARFKVLNQVRKYGRDPREGVTAKSSSAIDIEEGRTFWAFQRPVKPPLPPIQNETWPLTEVDRFVLEAQEKRSGQKDVGAKT